MKLSEVLSKLFLLGEPRLNVACFGEGERTVQIRVQDNGVGLEWTWFGFPNEGDPDLTRDEIGQLYERAASSSEWYLDEIELD